MKYDEKGNKVMVGNMFIIDGKVYEVKDVYGILMVVPEHGESYLLDEILDEGYIVQKLKRK
jgi:hypothetical protein